MPLTGANLKHLRALHGLKELDISQTNVSDAGLEHLTGLTSLEQLHVWDTCVTNAGVAQLKKSLPNCKVRRGL